VPATRGTNPARPGQRRGWLLAATLLVLAVALAVPFALTLPRDATEPPPATAVVESPERAASYVNRLLGPQRVPGVEETGLWETQFTKKSNEPYRWTNGQGRLIVPIQGRPRELRVRLGVPIPRPYRRVCIQVNGQPLFDEPVQMPFEWSRSFDLSRMDLGHEAVIDIISDTFHPERDDRILGVCVRGITLVCSTADGPK
jgi:hypothetical protein